MTFFLALLGAIVGALVGASIGFFGLIWIGEMTGADNQQGALAMGAAMTGLPLGLAIGAVLGCVLVIRWRRRSGARRMTRIQSFSAIALTGATLLGLYAFFVYEAPKPYFEPGPGRPVLLAEIRLPAAMVDLEFIAGRRSMIRTFDDTYYDADTTLQPRREGDDIILTSQQPLIFSHEGRSLHLWVSSRRLLIFDLDLPANPPKTEAFSDWQPVDHLRPGFYEADVPETDKAGIHLRFRVERGS